MINVLIAIDNVVIKPGDLVVADDDGIFVVDPQFAKEYGERAVTKQNGEPATKTDRCRRKPAPYQRKL